MRPARVVVVGHGMVGARFVEELVERVAGTRGGAGAVEVTVLGAEEYEPYNRVLLSEVVAGKVDVASLTLPRRDVEGVRVLPGVAARAVDRGRRVVLADDGSSHAYDHLVLATGARARVPVLAGLVPGDPLPAGVHALRTLDDAREIVAATVNARRAVVLGGGVLGLEAACGLARRGLHVTVVHGGPHAMDRQLDADAGHVVGRGLAALGVDVRADAAAEGVVLDGGRARGLRLGGADGGVVPAELVVLTAGTEPETALARAAGLAVGRGVVVDRTCTTTDPRVHAIGDCAEPPEGGTGLVAQGWDQARRLATRLAAELTDSAAPGGTGAALTTGRAPDEPSDDATGTDDVVRLKAHGLDVVAMGVCGSRRDLGRSVRSVRLSDPDGGRHVEVVVADGVLVGATCVGDARVAVDLTAAYTRRTPVPADPAQLLLHRVAGAASAAAEPSPTLMPDRATVCRCNGVTKGDIVTCFEHGAREVEDVARATRATTGCGGCTEAVCGIVDWLRRSTPGDASAGPVGAGSRTGETALDVRNRTGGVQSAV
ncbi:FAD-dependent oxidoreductase [Actinotalea sp. AC32]|nr:FAD-dependent oxidoreductase [Actinotalea sp. AC32]